MVKTAGLADILRSALAPLAQGIRVAFVYGAFAHDSEHRASDVDVTGAARDGRGGPLAFMIWIIIGLPHCLSYVGRQVFEIIDGLLGVSLLSGA